MAYLKIEFSYSLTNEQAVALLILLYPTLATHPQKLVNMSDSEVQAAIEKGLRKGIDSVIAEAKEIVSEEA
jgi:hypothetical protein